MIKMMTILKDYEAISGQLINRSKSFFYLHEKTPLIYFIRLRKLTRIRQLEFTITYLRCPIFYGRKKSVYFEEILRKISRRILAWQSRLLTFGGKLILTRHVLQTMPIYLLSTMNPTVTIIKTIHQVLAKFFWKKKGEQRRHWAT